MFLEGYQVFAKTQELWHNPIGLSWHLKDTFHPVAETSFWKRKKLRMKSPNLQKSEKVKEKNNQWLLQLQMTELDHEIYTNSIIRSLGPNFYCYTSKSFFINSSLCITVMEWSTLITKFSCCLAGPGSPSLSESSSWREWLDCSVSQRHASLFP